jgi:glycosyltransferase involved in cell wall biosynthesis
MKILICLPDFSVGGAQRVMLTYGSFLTQRSHKVDIVVCSKHGQLVDEIDDNVNLFTFSEKPISLWQQMKFLFFLIRFFSKNKDYDATLVTMYQFSTLVTIAHTISLNKSTLIIREANFPSIEMPKSRTWPAVFPITRWAYHQCDRIICLSEDQKLDVIDFFNLENSKLVTIPNPALTDKTDELSFEELNLDNFGKGPLILAIGRLEAQKRYDVLMKAFQLYRKRNNCGELLILGEGGQKQKLLDLVLELNLDGHVHFLGIDINPYKYLRNVDLYVLSSDYEGSPNSLIQACYYTRRVVSTNCPSGPREILRNGILGSLVNVGDFYEMSLEMEYVLNSKKVSIPKDWLEQFRGQTVVDKIIALV